ncbi:hypothetical protein, partial [Kitasatospora acidiphila]|uniref:hypothetical protein n=1 Tax=Kitasatospora acidiphila TaxID=2567942 RepID=UPI001C672802
ADWWCGVGHLAQQVEEAVGGAGRGVAAQFAGVWVEVGPPGGGRVGQVVDPAVPGRQQFADVELQLACGVLQGF